MYNGLLSAFAATCEDVVCAAAIAGAKWGCAGGLRGGPIGWATSLCAYVKLCICQYGLKEASIASNNANHGV